MVILSFLLQSCLGHYKMQIVLTMRGVRLVLVTAIFSGWLLGTAQADIYMYVDSNGVRHITNNPQGDGRYQRVMATPQYQRPRPSSSTVAPEPAQQTDTVLSSAPVAQGVISTSRGEWQLIAPREGRQVRSASVPVPAGSTGLPFRVNETNRQQYAPYITRIATQHGIDPYLVHAVISAESAFNPNAVSPAGAMGLMQLMPATAERFGVSNAFDPVANIEGGVRYLRWLLNHFNNDVQLALAGYNAGENAVIRHGRQIPPFAETQTYVPRVLRFYHYYRQQALGG